VIAAGSHRYAGQKAAHVQSWFVSILLHGTVVFVALLLMKHIQLAPEDESFKWNVAMVSPAHSNQAPVAAVPSTTSISSQPPVQQFTRAQALPSHQPIAQQAIPSIAERTVSPVTTEPVKPIPRQSIALSQSAAHTIQPAEPIRHEPVAPMVSEASSIVKPSDASAPVSEESDDQTAILEETAQSVQTPAPTQMAAISPAPTNAPTKLDYGWLSETILRRVEELKRYPASARMDRAEGKVVVKAVIHEGGSIGDVEVFQSSGHPGLDKAAIETLRQAAPFLLSRPLGQPHMTIKIPMSYRLDR
jgi:periplasmic protein TonB